ncbi:MAG TPA: type II toxin-antitoxin system Phd/YefM family antitoxin [Planctomycetota bacterium]|nr:type II toxin-antitoxin system Phd/YefM family antitoxin [Planctomycetota bacterium]HRR82513.1 type II toxin-antitoxin system Phd/YefM family antitoxin [Planctomycetota bacterium]HRT97718.1 type II toxin-antitoxin system Phd/YefM family antitoxin [Planctomycetota bacterium]
MDRIGVFDAKTHFSQLIDDVARHRRRVVIERRGRPLAIISPYEETVKRDEAEKWAWIFRELDDILASQAPPRPGERIQDLIEEGRER